LGQWFVALLREKAKSIGGACHAWVMVFCEEMAFDKDVKAACNIGKSGL